MFGRCVHWVEVHFSHLQHLQFLIRILHRGTVTAVADEGHKVLVPA
jgi:hypothetical protein